MDLHSERPVSRSGSRAVPLERRDVLRGVSRPTLYFLLAATLSFFLTLYLSFGSDHELRSATSET